MGILQDLNVSCSGDGPETLVLLHGFGTDQTVWRHVLADIPAGRRVVRFDLACAGSVRPEVFNLARHGSLDGVRTTFCASSAKHALADAPSLATLSAA